MFKRNLLHYSAPIIQLLTGLCIGIACSLILAPFLERSKCDQRIGVDRHGLPSWGSSLSNKQAVVSDYDQSEEWFRDGDPPEKESFNDLEYNWNNDDFIARIKPLPHREQTSTVDSSLRPRYISTELGIREKLLVAVLTTKDTLDTFGVAINKTLTHFVTKTVFFTNTRKPNLPSGMSLVVFNEEKPHSTGLQMLGFIGKQYLNNYDWFLLLKDTTYVRGRKVFDLVSDTNVADDVLLGYPRRDTTEDRSDNFCDLGAGIILSQSMMSRVVQRLDWCHDNIYDRQDDLIVGKCIMHCTERSCNTVINSIPQKFVVDPSFVFRESLGGANDPLLDALTVSRVTEDTTIYKLHRFYSENDLKSTAKLLEKTKKTIEDIAWHTPDVATSLSWPLGVDPPTLPVTRFDVILWDYFTETHLYLDGDFTNMKPLIGVHKEDVTDVIHQSTEYLAKKYPGQYAYKQLVNGYRRFDASRGMDYILDLGLYDRTAHKQVTKRVRLMRPLGAVELVPMPYVTENSRVNLILSVTAENRDSVVNFLDSYAHTCLESGDNTYLYVVFVYHGDETRVGDTDKYSVLKSMISFYENKYQNGARIAWTAIQNNQPTVYTIMDSVSRKFSPESLFLLCTVGMELSIEFLNRVRMNTIANWQVFFPIAFWQYKPNLVHEEKPYPTTIDIDRGVGHFDGNSYDHASLYNSDYQYARKQMISTNAPKDIDLFAMFLKYHNLHLLRAVEPALKIRYRETICDPTLPPSAYQQCLTSRGEGLASQAQLAMLIFEHQQKLDQIQMNVMHQQNGPNVGQMKPDMLR